MAQSDDDLGELDVFEGVDDDGVHEDEVAFVCVCVCCLTGRPGQKRECSQGKSEEEEKKTFKDKADNGGKELVVLHSTLCDHRMFPRCTCFWNVAIEPQDAILGFAPIVKFPSTHGAHCCQVAQVVDAPACVRGRQPACEEVHCEKGPATQEPVWKGDEEYTMAEGCAPRQVVADFVENVQVEEGQMLRDPMY